MFCAFHPANAATAQCTSCNRPLCAACDHRIKARPYCEDCIVAGVESFRRSVSTDIGPAGSMPPPVPQRSHSPAKATFCSLIPGLGAVYNRQNLKALVHFAGTVGLMEVGDATNMDFFVFGGIIFYLFTIIDANRTAKAISAGASPRDDEQRIQWLFSRYKPVWGLLLCLMAFLVVLATLPVLPIGVTPARIWAFVLFSVGGYLIVSYFRSLSREEQTPSFPAPPRSVVSAMLPPDRHEATNSYPEQRSTSHLER